MTPEDLSTIHHIIANKVKSRNIGIPNEIALRKLYFRVSIVGACNLKCPFCHNEGGPTNGLIDENQLQRVMVIAKEIGFTRIQFTGGEPLIHPKLANFVGYAKSIFSDVGVTTNGSFLKKKIDGLIHSGIDRIHISLQEEELTRKQGKDNSWITPTWLIDALSKALSHDVAIKLNLPVSPHHLFRAKEYIERPECSELSIQLFSILPTKFAVEDSSVENLVKLADDENIRRVSINAKGRIIVRKYLPPSGVRCGDCSEFSNCKEQSHSLRFGVDGVLRPCLASREWDIRYQTENLFETMSLATLMALDYSWPSISTLKGYGNYE
jgi:molybdenum cofactor biosynthesis enzyme MoaA